VQAHDPACCLAWQPADLQAEQPAAANCCFGVVAESGRRCPATLLCRRTIPPAARLGSRLVFRQGSPLLPTDLSNVAASKARSTIIISDQSRGRDEADAQSLR
jgi:hypothetical protein